MTSPASNAYKDTYRNPLRYTGQSYRYVPTYLRKRDPIAPQNMSPDVKPPEQQGYYPVNSLWTNTTNKNVWLLRGISNNLGDWVLISNGGGGGGTTFINTDNALVPSNAGVFYFSSPNITIVGDSGTGAIVFNASPVLNDLKFNVTSGVSPISPQNGEINFTSADGTVVTTGSNPNNIDFSVPGAIKTITTDFSPTSTIPGTTEVVNNNFAIIGNSALPGEGTHGIITKSIPYTPPGPNPVNAVMIKYANGDTTTNNAADTVVAEFSVSINSGFTISCTYIAYDTTVGVTQGDTFGGRLVVVGKNLGGIVTIDSILESVSSGSVSMTSCACFVQGALGNLEIVVKGIVGRNIDWHVLIPWIATTS